MRLQLYRLRIAWRAGATAKWAARKGFTIAARQVARTAAGFAFRAMGGTE